MKNLKVNVKKIMLVGALGGSLVLCTGCGNRKIITPGAQTYNTAIIIRNNNAAVIDIESWKDFDDGEQLEIWTNDGTSILTTAYDTKLVNTEKSNIDIEELCRTLIGPDGTISYYDQNVKTKTK